MPSNKMHGADVGHRPDVQSHAPSHAPFEDEISELETRVAGARILREHHIWEAVRISGPLAGLREDTAAFARFRDLMAFDSLADALFLLAAKSCPVLCIRSITRSPYGWLCRIALEDKQAKPHLEFSPSCHPDRSAAVLLALLAAMRAKETERTRWGDGYVQ